MNLTARKIIRRPIISEKTLGEAALGKYTFEVAMNANKIEIRKAIEEIFKVKVLKVNTMVVRGKLRGIGRKRGKRSNWKKAIITLPPEQKIELEGINYFEQ